jgi:threonine/homoserine/homoserine lactone efflux protein
MNIIFLCKSIAVGLIGAPPMGLIALVCFQRTLSQGRILDSISGFGAAAADALLAFIAAFGLAFVSNFFIKEQMSLRLVGGALLCCSGVKVVFSRVIQRAALDIGGNYIINFTSTFLLTLANLVIFLTITAVLAGFGLVKPGTDCISAVLLAVGVFTGSQLSWPILCCITEKIFKMLGYSGVRQLSRVAGIILVVSGLFILLNVILCRQT